ncbi:MAG: trypsin-like serine protease [Gemmatimonadota bacterium]
MGARRSSLAGSVDIVDDPFDPEAEVAQARRDAVVLHKSIAEFGGATECTGTLISPRIVLTAYHCVEGADSFPVTFGPNPEEEVLGLEPRTLASIGCVAFEGARKDGLPAACGDVCDDPDTVDFERCAGDRDIAILVLDRRVDWPVTGDGSPTAIPASVVTEDPLRFGAPTPIAWIGTEARAVGYGLSSADPRVRPAVRQFADVTINAVDPPSASLRIDSGTTFRGDSGGPTYLGDPDVEPIEVLGVHRGPDVDVLVTDPEVREFLQDQLVSFFDDEFDDIWLGPADFPPEGDPDRPPEAELTDPDGDGLIDDHDNCPNEFNPAQLDGDRDGVGDACDDCPDQLTPRPIPDEDGDDVDDRCDNCPIFNPVDEETGEQPDRDGDGIGDACDVCPDRPDEGAPNCNVDAEVAASRDQVPDACDPEPCPDTFPVNVTEDSDVLVEGEPVEFLTNRALGNVGLMASTDDRTRPLGEGAVTGFRFCPCDVADSDSPSARLECEFRADCDIRAELFDLDPRGVWPTLSLRNTGGRDCTVDPDRGDLRCAVTMSTPDVDREPQLGLRWDFVADAERLGIDIGDTGVFDRPSVRTVLWAHSLEFPEGTCDPVPPLIPARDCNVDREVSSDYFTGEIFREVRGRPPERPDFGPGAFLPQGSCPACDGAFRLGWFVAEPCVFARECPLELFVRLPQTDLDAAAFTNDAARRAMTTPGRVWLEPEEPAFVRRADAPAIVALSENGSELESSLFAIGGRLFEGGTGQLPPGDIVFGAQSSNPETPKPIPRESFGAIYRAQEPAVYLFGGIDPRTGEPLGDLWRFEVERNRWAQLPFLPAAAGFETERVLAMTYRLQDRSLYVLGERETEPSERGTGRGRRDRSAPVPGGRSEDVPRGPRREVALLRVPLDGSASEVLSRWPRRRVFDRHGMAMAPDGTLVIVASASRAKRWVAVRLPLDSTREDDGFVLTDRGALLSRVVADPRGVSFALETRDGVRQAGGFAYGEMRRVPALRLREWL